MTRDAQNSNKVSPVPSAVPRSARLARSSPLPVQSPVSTGRQNALSRAANVRSFIQAPCSNLQDDSLFCDGLYSVARSGLASTCFFGVQSHSVGVSCHLLKTRPDFDPCSVIWFLCSLALNAAARAA